MIDNIILEGEIKTKFRLLNEKLTNDEKKAFHFKSIDNFIKHIFETKADKKNNKKLFKINLERNKSLILEYLIMIERGEASKIGSKTIYTKYIEPIGEFMNRNYGFSFSGGNFMYFHFLIYTSIGMVIDLIIWAIFNNLFYIFTILFLSYSIVKTHIKSIKGKLYGPNF